MMVGKRGTPFERFERYWMPVPMAGCWIWLGSINKNGYGQIGMPGSIPMRAHQLSYQLFKGLIPKGFDVRHTCNIRCCVNPDHLLVGTRKQNMEDAERHGTIARGFKLPHTKIAGEEKQKILNDPRPYAEIAREYGVTKFAIGILKNRNGIYRYKKWRQV